jgi:hypothetical protein
MNGALQGMNFKKVFVGYLSTNLTPAKIADSISDLCPDVIEIQVMRKRVGFQSQVYCCALSFASENRRSEALTQLGAKTLKGHTLICRPWVERSAANERRDVYWRNRDWNRQERRSKDRREYQPWQATFETSWDKKGIRGMKMLAQPAR